MHHVCYLHKENKSGSSENELHPSIADFLIMLLMITITIMTTLIVKVTLTLTNTIITKATIIIIVIKTTTII